VREGNSFFYHHRVYESPNLSSSYSFRLDYLQPFVSVAGVGQMTVDFWGEVVAGAPYEAEFWSV
jgi:hypothetical protein